MPALANITIKKADAVTDITYTGLSPASGDGSPAIWRQEDASKPYGHRATLAIKSVWNGPKTARRVEATYRYPQVITDTTTGLKSSPNQVPLTVSGTFPASMPDTDIQEAVAQAFNLCNSPLVRSQFSTQYAAT